MKYGQSDLKSRSSVVTRHQISRNLSNVCNMLYFFLLFYSVTAILMDQVYTGQLLKTIQLSILNSSKESHIFPLAFETDGLEDWHRDNVAMLLKMNSVLWPYLFLYTGRYRCEVSSEAPKFSTKSGFGDLIVLVLPSSPPIIKGIQCNVMHLETKAYKYFNNNLKKYASLKSYIKL